jgi:hypothetical protein
MSILITHYLDKSFDEYYYQTMAFVNSSLIPLDKVNPNNLWIYEKVTLLPEYIEMRGMYPYIDLSKCCTEAGGKLQICLDSDCMINTSKNPDTQFRVLREDYANREAYITIYLDDDYTFKAKIQYVDQHPDFNPNVLHVYDAFGKVFLPITMFTTHKAIMFSKTD